MTANEQTRINQYTVRHGPELTVERTFAAPRDLVFRAFTEPEHLRQWWGPAGWTVPYITVDLRPGGKWHYCMRAPDDAGEYAGMESWGLTTFEEIVPPEKLVYTDAFSDAEGNVNTAMPQSTTTLEFVDDGGQTRVISRTRYSSADELDKVLAIGMVEGLTQTHDRLDAHLRAVQTGAREGFTLIRTFNAAPEQVFAAWTEPARFAQWFGAPGRVPVESVSMDVRPGGAWRATLHAGPDGQHVIHWSGHYVEVTPAERLVLTLTDTPGDEGDPLVVTFNPWQGQTEMVFRQPAGGLTPEQLAGARQGWNGFFDALAAGLAA